MTAEWDWKALATAVAASRQALGWTQCALADKAGVSRPVASGLESGKPRLSILAVTLGKFEEALGWEPGDAMRLLKGGDTMPLAAVAAEPPPKSNLREGDLRGLNYAMSNTAVTVNSGQLSRLVAELDLLRDRLSRYEALPEDDGPF